jgi:hypothetical protein
MPEFHTKRKRNAIIVIAAPLRKGGEGEVECRIPSSCYEGWCDGWPHISGNLRSIGRGSAATKDQGRQQLNSEDRKGVVARVWSRVQSLWLQPNGSTCQLYLGIAVPTLASAAFMAMAGVNILVVAETLVLGLLVASLVKRLVWRDEKLLAVRNVLLDIAFQECRCSPNAIITESPDEPELVGQPIGKGHCHACQSRAALKEQFPEAIETEIRERLGEYRNDDGRWILNNFTWLQHKTGWPIPKDLDLAAYLSPAELKWHRADGQLHEAHEAKPQ